MDEFRRRLAYHEAGHVVAGRRLGLELVHATVSTADDVPSITRWQESITDKQRVVTSAAGAAAEFLGLGSILGRGSFDDQRKARRAAESLATARDCSAAQVALEGRVRAMRLIADDWRHVCAVAEHLCARGSIDNPTVVELAGSERPSSG